MGVANYPDNLSRAFSEGWACTGADQDSILEWIAIGPILPGHGFVDNSDAGCGSIVQPGEIAATHEWNFESIEIAI